MWIKFIVNRNFIGFELVLLLLCVKYIKFVILWKLWVLKYLWNIFKFINGDSLV